MEKSHKLKHIIGVPSIDRAYGGPARTVTGLFQHLENSKLDSFELWHGPSKEPVTVTSASTRELSLSELVRQGLHQISRESLVHDNGIWTPWNLTLAGVTFAKGAKLVISTRGMLEPWALQQQKLKKRAAWRLYQQRILSQASLLIATAQEEIQAIRALGIQTPIALIPNGVEVPDGFARTAKSPSSTKTVLFLSRIHPKKGLELALDAWGRARPEGWKFRIVGSGDRDYIDALRTRIRHMGLSDAISIEGPLDGLLKSEAYREANIFLLPTYSENFGVVVAEALVRGTPVITTHGAPWSGLIEHRCGWWVPVEVGALSQALEEAFSMPAKELEAMGARGAKWVAKTFAWPAIATQTAQAYNWVLKGCLEKSREDFIQCA